MRFHYRKRQSQGLPYLVVLHTKKPKPEGCTGVGANISFWKGKARRRGRAVRRGERERTDFELKTNPFESAKGFFWGGSV